MTATAAAGQSLPALKRRIARYYSAKVLRHGATARGVDWACETTQQLRFAQLLRLCDFSTPFSIDDLGCGWGALLGYLALRHRRANVDYLGIDLSAAMIECARKQWASRRGAAFQVGERSPRMADYGVASGLFNVRLDEPLTLWEGFIEETLRNMAASSRLGFAVNFLAPLPPGMAGPPQLHRSTPQRWVAFCEDQLKTRTELTLLQAYGMREFTLLARH